MAVVVGIWVFEGGSRSSRHPPNHPGYLHDEVWVGDEEVVVSVGAGAGVALCDVLVVEVSVSSLQPNHPGVLHVDVDDVEVVVVLVCGFVVVGSSRQPHQPGVLQVSVLVLVDLLVEVEVGLVKVVVVSVPLLSKYSQV